MANTSRSRNQNAEYRRKRADAKIENLKGIYPELQNINGNMHLGTLKERLGATSL